jgi:hypothetical protein
MGLYIILQNLCTNLLEDPLPIFEEFNARISQGDFGLFLGLIRGPVAQFCRQLS